MSNINKVNSRDVKAVLTALPANINKLPQTRNLSLREAAEVQGLLKLSTVSINGYISIYQSFFDWADKNGHASPNPFVGMRVGTSKGKAAEKRHAFSAPALQAVYRELTENSRELVKKGSHKWATLIGMYSGARLNEICQMATADLQQQDGIWFFNLMDEDDSNKHFKTAVAIRKVPVHAELLRLGLLNYRQEMERQTTPRLFPDYSYCAKNGFPNDAVTRIDPDTIRKNRGKPPKNASLFFTIFQTFMTGEGTPVYKQYEPDFFDFIVIDECHRGGAKDESEWRGLLEYFAPAAQLGLTATPKRKHNADTYAYFGEPVYTYALRDGIEDGFLTPFKVRQMASTIDEYVYDGSDMVVTGEIEDGETFTESDFNTRIIIPERELARVQEFMGQIDQRQKTLVFCATQNHAALVRDLINQVKTSTNPNYCHRVTADDGAIGDQHLRDFQDNEKTIPTILTTSQKLSTGVDARNIRHIVLMRPITSMIEFKQIIGRGTRTYDGKDFFTIWDFVRAHENFNDPEWDGEPLEPEPPGPPRPTVEPTEGPDPTEPGAEEGPRQKIVVQLADGKARSIRFIATTTYWSADGKPISAADFLARLFGDLSKLIADEDQLRTAWSDPDNRAHLLKQLEDSGYDADRLEDIRLLVDAAQSDLFDVLAYVLFTNPPKTRLDRAKTLRDHRMDSFKGEMADLLLSILKAYEAKGESELATRKLGQFLTARYGSVGESKGKLGELATVRDAFRRMQAALYVD